LAISLGSGRDSVLMSFGVFTILFGKRVLRLSSRTLISGWTPESSISTNRRKSREWAAALLAERRLFKKDLNSGWFAVVCSVSRSFVDFGLFLFLWL
jgi:hypothetical protein